jgi:hypothetical protein
MRTKEAVSANSGNWAGRGAKKEISLAIELREYEFLAGLPAGLVSNSDGTFISE